VRALALANGSDVTENTNLAGAGLIDVAFDELAGTTAQATLDFGGGALGSSGENCISGGALDTETLKYQAAMRTAESPAVAMRRTETRLARPRRTTPTRASSGARRS
jgi:hypothetical protein